jgi:polyhydroxybutyrate depolymerase
MILHSRAAIRGGAFLALTIACSSERSDPEASTGDQTKGGTSSAGQTPSGAPGTGGGATAGSGALGGAGSGGAPVAGAASGGRAPVAGAASGGRSDGGMATGGAVAAGTGGSATGAGSGGKAAAGAPSAGAGGASGAATGGTAGGTSIPCSSSGWSPGDERITLTHDGIEREYEVHVPPSYTGTTRVPLVMTIHGAHNTIAMVKGWSKMNPVADANGFIVVYPQAVDCWNAGFTIGGCEAAPDDVGFLKAVVAEVESHACIDPKQVYATGISNGSMMSQYLACEASDVFAAVAGVSGGAQCRNTVPRPVPLFYVHGTEDKTIGYSGAQRTADAWVMRDGCSTTPMETYNMGSTKCVTYGACREGAEVVFCTVTGMGHCWPEDSNCGPGGGAAYGVTDFKASPMMWEFFKRHPLP